MNPTPLRILRELFLLFVMVALITTLSMMLLFAVTHGAPAPLPKDDVRLNDIRVGFRWLNWNYDLEVYHIQGKQVWFRDFEFKNPNFYGNPTTRTQIRKVIKECPQSKHILDYNRRLR
jgi:hypothetical protein